MKKILITGVNSYIGNAVQAWLENNPEKYEIDIIDLKNENWRDLSFSSYDVLFHVAGIAHVSTDPKLESLYFKINRDLTIEVAQKAKKEAVKQFIFMSSMIVYGNHQMYIDKNTIPQPNNFYGQSKLQAEQGIQDLNDNQFKVAIIRPPMIYGKESKGNYPRLAKLALRIPLFPNIKNHRSMLHIDNLCEFIRLLIDNEDAGIFFPQNREYVQTSELVKEIAKTHHKSIFFTSLFNPMIKLLKNINLINKVFGDSYYDMKMSEYSNGNYQIRSFEESIYLSELREDK